MIRIRRYSKLMAIGLICLLWLILLPDRIMAAPRTVKVGYSELFRRFGEKYQRVSPLGGEEAKAFHKKQVSLVAKANGVADVQKLYAKTGGSLTRVALEIEKIKLKEDAESAISC